MKMLHLNIWRDFRKTLMRFISIVILLGLGSFVYVGLKSTGHDMRQTVRQQYQRQQLADAKISPTAAFQSQDLAKIKKLTGVKKAEFGYQTDVLLNNQQTVQVISAPQTLSKVTITSGQLPKNNTQIVLSSQLKGQYRLGEKITLHISQKKPASSLKHATYTIVGFATSSEYLKKDNLGSTNVGTGEIASFAVLSRSAFTAKNPNVARLSFKGITGQAYERKYERAINQRVTDLQPKLNQIADDRQQTLTTQLNNQIKQGQALQKQLTKLGQDQKAHQLKTQIATANAKLKQVSQIDYQIQSRNDYNNGYSDYGQSADRIGVLSNSFPILFFAVAILVCFTTMKRMVDEKWIEIGTLRALGYSKGQVMSEFISYGVLAAVIGAGVGIYLGVTLLPKVIFQAYTANFVVGDLQLETSLAYVAIAVVVSLLCALLAILPTGYRTLNHVTADLLVARPPKTGSHILLERIKPLWRHLSFSYKVTARNLFRYKSRTFMTILGVGGCVALLITGFGIRDSLNNILKVQYSEIVHYDLIGVHQTNSASEADNYVNAIQNNQDVQGHTPIYYQNLVAKSADMNDNQTIGMIVPEDKQQLKKYIDLQSATSGTKQVISNDGALVTAKFAKLMKLQTGDYLTLKNNVGHQYRIKVAGITRMYVGHNLFMSPQYYQKIFGKQVDYNAQMIKTKSAKKATVDAVSRDLNKQKAAVMVVQTQTGKVMIHNTLGSLNHVVYVLTIAASLLAFVVLYTLTNINVSERSRELATIEVLGFYPKEVLMYIFRETITLTIVGILVGYLGGDIFHRYIMDVLPPETAMASSTLAGLNLVLSTLITALFLLVVMGLMRRKIQRINMLGALKSVD